MPDLPHPLILFVAGLVAGTLNVIAGGGSFLTLPILIFTGLPATVANGTNRVGILFQSVSAAWGFHRHGVLRWSVALQAALPAAVGAVFGTWVAVIVGDEEFRRILSLLMVVITLWTLLARDPRRRERESASRSVDGADAPNRPGSAAETADARLPGGSTDGSPEARGVAPRRKWILGLAFLGVGFYGGFVQAGVGFFILAVTTFAGLDLVRGNAVKVVCVLAFTLLSLSIFAWQDLVVWSSGLALAAGTVLGGQIGVRFTTLKGHRWVRIVVTVTVILFAIRLWFA